MFAKLRKRDNYYQEKKMIDYVDQQIALIK